MHGALLTSFQIKTTVEIESAGHVSEHIFVMVVSDSFVKTNEVIGIRLFNTDIHKL